MRVIFIEFETDQVEFFSCSRIISVSTWLGNGEQPGKFGSGLWATEKGNDVARLPGTLNL
jgi:hypothetical protein